MVGRTRKSQGGQVRGGELQHVQVRRGMKSVGGPRSRPVGLLLFIGTPLLPFFSFLTSSSSFSYSAAGPRFFIIAFFFIIILLLFSFFLEGIWPQILEPPHAQDADCDAWGTLLSNRKCSKKGGGEEADEQDAQEDDDEKAKKNEPPVWLQPRGLGGLFCQVTSSIAT